MRLSWPAVILALATLPTHAAVTASTPPALQAELLRITQTLVDAIPVGDQAAWQRTLTEDAVIIDEFGRIQHKQEAVASLHPFPAGFTGSIALRDAHTKQYGNVAILQVEQDERETVFDQHFVVRYQSLLSFVKQDGAWKLAGYEDVTIPTAPPKLVVSGLVPDDYVGSYRYAPDRMWTVSARNGVLGYVTQPGRPLNVLQPIAKDVFMGSDDERNLLIFHRDAHGKVDTLIERRKFNDLRLTRIASDG